MFILKTVIACIILFSCIPAHAQNWETLRACRLLENKSNDGDSFHVEYKGTEYIFRLYFADTPESESDSRVVDRIADQAAHFGVTEEESMKWGKTAKDFTEKILSKPFTVVTRFQKAMGASKLQRFYAVILPEGGNTDLAEILVEAGLARAFGQVANTPRGKVMADYKRMEKVAKSRKMGAYGGGKPSPKEALDVENNAVESSESAETESANNTPVVAVASSGEPYSDTVYTNMSETILCSLGEIGIQTVDSGEPPSPALKSQELGKININTATHSELDTLPGVGDVTAKNIINGRPYGTVEDLKRVPKLGDGTIQRIAPLVEF
jgi:DNA uptake protein ComE-like DNA-binding protein